MSHHVTSNNLRLSSFNESNNVQIARDRSGGACGSQIWGRDRFYSKLRKAWIAVGLVTAHHEFWFCLGFGLWDSDFGFGLWDWGFGLSDFDVVGLEFVMQEIMGGFVAWSPGHGLDASLCLRAWVKHPQRVISNDYTLLDLGCHIILHGHAYDVD